MNKQTSSTIIFAIIALFFSACQSKTPQISKKNTTSLQLDKTKHSLKRNKNEANLTEEGDTTDNYSLRNPHKEQTIPSPNIQGTTEEYDFHEYKNLNLLLQRYVTNKGKVNYVGIKKDKTFLHTIIEEFESNFPSKSWSNTQRLTYWINAYNLYTIKLVVDNYPTTSITKIAANPWNRKFIRLDGKKYDLNTIENEIIRKQFNEPRIHFALNCASESCPILLNRAYIPEKLDEQLTTQTKRFINDTTKNDFSNPKKIKISKLFDWYKEDFEKKGTLIDFINRYRTEQLTKPQIEYKKYSWKLNSSL